MTEAFRGTGGSQTLFSSTAAQVSREADCRAGEVAVCLCGADLGVVLAPELNFSVVSGPEQEKSSRENGVQSEPC